MAIQRKISAKKNRELVGREVSVLVEGPSAETDLLWQGRMSTQAPEIDGVVLINDIEGEMPQPGQIRRLLITETHDYDILGTLLPATESWSVPNAPPPSLISITPAVQLPAR
jgi:ribosomal protein S12 methylthiotransferase